MRVGQQEETAPARRPAGVSLTRAEADDDVARASQEELAALVRCIAAYDEDVAAYVARKLLRPGHPCPVCGSGKHPSPARAGADTDGAEYELQEARRRREEAEARLASAGATRH